MAAGVMTRRTVVVRVVNAVPGARTPRAVIAQTLEYLLRREKTPGPVDVNIVGDAITSQIFVEQKTDLSIAMRANKTIARAWWI